MARPSREAKNKAPATHAEKLARSVRDTKDLLVLFGLLLVILVGWDLYFVFEVGDLQGQLDKRQETRRLLDEGVEPRFARRALERLSNRQVAGDLRDRVYDYVEALNIKFKQGNQIKKGREARIDLADKEQRDDITFVETVELENIHQIEMWRLIELLVELKNRSNRNIWCTQIEGMTPIRDAEGFVLTTLDRNAPVYDIKGLRIARFTEIKPQP